MVVVSESPDFTSIACLFQIAGVAPFPLKNAVDGTYSLEELKFRYETGDNPHKARSSLIAIETAFNGRVVPLDFLKQVKEYI